MNTHNGRPEQKLWTYEIAIIYWIYFNFAQLFAVWAHICFWFKILTVPPFGLCRLHTNLHSPSSCATVHITTLTFPRVLVVDSKLQNVRDFSRPSRCTRHPSPGMLHPTGAKITADWISFNISRRRPSFYWYFLHCTFPMSCIKI